jgi:hypothetical protein
VIRVFGGARSAFRQPKLNIVHRTVAFYLREF